MQCTFILSMECRVIIIQREWCNIGVSALHTYSLDGDGNGEVLSRSNCLILYELAETR